MLELIKSVAVADLPKCQCFYFGTLFEEKNVNKTQNILNIYQYHGKNHWN